MTEKRYTIKPQDDLFGVVDNYSADKVCVINGIRTEIEAKWLCKDMNTLNDENEQLKELLNKLEEFEVFESDRIQGAVVTNNEYSLTLHSNNEAYMVCNMINRFIRGVKNGNT